MNNRLFCMMGKSASGKDHLFRELMQDPGLAFTPVVTYTTRPIRKKEEEGREYFFRTEEDYAAMKRDGRIIEERSYQTQYGTWRYFTAEDGQIDLSSHSSLVIGTLESFEAFRSYYGTEKVVPLYIEVEDGERLQRALKRERKQSNPGYAEMCRRFLADCEDFSEEKLLEAGIKRRFENIDKEECLQELRTYILEKTGVYF